MELSRTLFGSEMLTGNDGVRLLPILIPLVEAAPFDEPLVEATQRLLERLPADSLLTAVADWWFTVSTGVATKHGLAFHLPAELPAEVVTPMNDLVALRGKTADLPPAAWFRKKLWLDDQLASLDHVLTLDWYGPSKLPQERPVWEEFVQDLAPTTQALKSGSPADPPRSDTKPVVKAMRAAQIQESSRRWNEILKRVRAATDQVTSMVKAQELVRPWDHPFPPQPMKQLPATGEASIDGLAEYLFGCLLGQPTPGIEAAIEALNDASSAASDEERGRLAVLVNADAFDAARLSSELAGARRDLRNLWSRIERLRRAGIDPITAELALLEGDVTAATSAVEAAESEVAHKDMAQRLSASASELRKTEWVDGAPPSNWDGLVNNLDTQIRDGNLALAEELVAELFDRRQEARRSHDLEALARIADALNDPRAPATARQEVLDYLDKLVADPARKIDRAFVDRMTERVNALEAQRQRDLAAALEAIASLLQEQASLFAPDAHHEYTRESREIMRLQDQGNIGEALRRAEALRDRMEQSRVHRWTAAEGEAALVEHLVAYCNQTFEFSEADVRRLYVAIKTRPFVVLAGLTGSGKSTIARLLAGAFGATTANGRFSRVAVRPDWIDQSDVLGTKNPLSDKFEPGWLALVARNCELNPDQLYFVLLDEMNLAPVEYYLADYLSALEEALSGAPAQLALYPDGAAPKNADDWSPTILFPTNLVVIGTVNVDETTRALSERVLDRANVLQLSSVVDNSHHLPRSTSVRSWSVPIHEWERLRVTDPDDGHHDFLVDVAETLREAGIGVGQRAHIEVERFAANARGVLGPEEALDFAILQRLIPKIRGFKRDLTEQLDALERILESADCQRSAQVVHRWLDERTADDEFIDGTDARLGLLA